MKSFRLYAALAFFLLPWELCAQQFKNINIGDGLPNSVVKSFGQDRDGFLWLGTFNGLCRYDGLGFVTYRHQDGNNESMVDNHLETISVQGNGVYAGTGKGLDFFDFRTGSFSRCFFKEGKHTSLIHSAITKIQTVGDKLYVLDIHGRLFYGKTGCRVFRKFPVLGKARILAVAGYQPGLMFVLSPSALFLVDLRQFRILRRLSLSGFPDNWNCMYYSRNLRMLLIGSGLGFESRGIIVDSHFAMSVSPISLPSDVKDILDYGKETIFATDGKGICILSSSGKRWLTPLNSTLSSFAVHALFADRQKNLWLGTYHDGMDFVSLKSEVFNIYNLGNGKLSHNVVSAVYGYRDKVCVGLDGGGIDVLNQKSGTRLTYTTFNSRLPGNHILSMAGFGPYVWLGIYGKGLCLFDLNQGSFYSYDLKKTGRNSRLYIGWNLFDDGRNHIVARGDWDYIIDKKTCKIVQIRKKNSEVKSLNEEVEAKSVLKGYHVELMSYLRDTNGNLWLGTDNGLFCTLKNSGRIVRFGKADGLISLEFSKRACWRNGDRLYFGTTRGLVFFHPEHLLSEKRRETVVFDWVKILKNNQEINLLGKQSNQVVLHYRQNFFTIHFAVPELVTPHQVRFKYRLQGLDKEWRIAEDIRDVTYTNLPHGSYTFYISTIGVGESRQNHFSTLYITVLPPWYLTWWAKLLALLLLVFLIYEGWHFLANRQAMRRLLAQKEYEREIEHRTNEEKLNFFVNITHELRTPMFLISAPLEELLGSSQRPVQVPYTYIKGMYRNAVRLNRLINRILDIRKMDSNEFKLYIQYLDVVKICRKLSVDYLALCAQKEISYSFQSSSEVLLADIDAGKLEIVITNLISNAYKYTKENGAVTLELIDQEESFSLLVKDTGIGIPSNQVDRLFEEYYRVKMKEGIEGHGLGLFIVKRLVNVMGGTIEVQSEVGKGSVFTVCLPKRQSSSDEHRVVLPEVDPYAKEKQENGKAVAEETVIQSPVATNTLLIIDDEPELVAMLENYFSREYKVLKACDGEKGLELAESVLPDLIICDVMMPKMNGLEFLDKIKSDKKLQHIPVILLSAKIMDEDKMAAFHYGADDYITKPVSLKLLGARVRQFLNRNENTLFGSLQKQDSENVKRVNKADQLFILKCKDIIDSNLLDPELGVDFLAEKMNMSHSALYKKVKFITGHSVVDMIVEYRIFRAVEMFKHGETNITHVCQQCGFNEVRSFRAAFKSRMGMSPSQFVQQM